MERDNVISTAGWSPWLNAIVMLIASSTTIAALSLQVRPGTDIVAAAFPPWWSVQQIFAASASANSVIVRTTAFSSVLVVRPDERDGLARLRQAGVWLTFDPRAIAACSSN